MRLKSLTVWSALAILAATTACEKASPTRPTEGGAASAAAESVTDARTGATIIAARPSAPANQATIRWVDQPITLTVTNGVTTGSTPLTYTFQVARDAGFSSIAFSVNNVAAGSGTTSVKPTQLAGGATYYWRTQANLGSATGPYSQVRSFTVGPEIVLGTPVLASPINGGNAFSPLSLVINNITRSGPVGRIVYSIQVASDAGFNNVLFSTDASEISGSTTTVTAAVSNLTRGATYYWRARASDPTNGITTAYSATANFVAQAFDLATAKFWDNPPDAGTWPMTAHVNYVEFTGFSMRVDFDKRTGPGKWPNLIPPGFQGPLQYTLGMCRFLQNQWHCSAVVQFWEGRDLDDTSPPSRFWREWWYDGQRWGPLADTVGPAEGEIVGIFVGAGDLRFRSYTRATCPNFCEISDVAMVPFTSGYAKYEF